MKATRDWSQGQEDPAGSSFCRGISARHLMKGSAETNESLRTRGQTGEGSGAGVAPGERAATLRQVDDINTQNYSVGCEQFPRG